MPGKARRVASRQAQLNRKRKRQNKGPTGIPALGPTTEDGNGHAIGDITSTQPTQTVPAAVAVPASEPPRRAPRPATAATSPARVRGERPATENYIAAELRRILALSGVVFVVIVALGITL
jgi:hypothetical protein